MRTETQTRDCYFNPFYENDTLLVQLILVEFVQVYETKNEIRSLFDHYFHAIEDQETLLMPLITKLAQVAGCSSTDFHSTFLPWSKRSLFKLTKYTELLFHHRLHQNKNISILNKVAHQACLIITQLLNISQALKLNFSSNEKNLECTQQFQTNLKKLEICFKQVSAKIPPMIHEYKENENVVLCVLRHKQALKHIYGERNFYKKFNCEPKELKGFLAQPHSERASQKGFEPTLGRPKEEIFALSNL